MGHINLVGLEVEGGWNGTRYKHPFDIPIIADHSIDGRTLQTDKPLKCTHVGEVVSAPMPPDPDAVGGWIDKYWPQHTNITCGFHIHTSFKSKRDYTLLTTKGFLLELVDTMQTKGKDLGLPPEHYFWARMRGGNPFTMLNFDASSQIGLRQKSVGNRTRYGMLNFAWNIHGTMEFRALPTFESADLARSFTFHYLSFIESFLDDNADKFCQKYSATLDQSCGEVSFSIRTSEVS